MKSFVRFFLPTTVEVNRGIRTTTAGSSLIRGAETVVLALPHLRREEERRPDEGLGASERVLHGLRDAEVRELGVPALLLIFQTDFLLKF